MSDLRIAILCPTPEYEEDWSHRQSDYARLLGNGAVFIDWTKANDFSGFDLVTPCWRGAIRVTARVGLLC